MFSSPKLLKSFGFFYLLKLKTTTTTTGIFPKISSDQETASLRANLHKFDREEISETELESIIQANIRRAVSEQIKTGIEIPTDGLIRWTDLFSPFMQAWDGITRRGIHRFYNTNTLYGEPVVESELSYNPSKTLADFQFAKTIDENTKAVLPGVFTFANACVDNFYQDTQKLRAAIAENLLAEAKALVEAGAKMIEIHELELAWGNYDSAEVTEIYKKFGELETKIVVIPYFQNFSQEIANILVQANCGVGIDFSQPSEISKLPENTILQAGVVNSRETKLESVEDLQKLKTEVFEKFPNVSEIIFSTSSHVEYLPHAIAIQKIELLRNFKNI